MELAIGILIGAALVLLWSGVWFVWDEAVAWFRRGDADLQRHIDEALTNSRERSEVAP